MSEEWQNNIREEGIKRIRYEISKEKKKLKLIPEEKDHESTTHGSRNTFEIIEEEMLIRITNGKKNIKKISKDVFESRDYYDTWGILLFIDDYVKLSDSYRKKLVDKLWRGGVNSLRFTSLEFSPAPLLVGNFQIHNDLKLGKIVNVVGDLQRAYENEDDHLTRYTLSILMVRLIYMDLNDDLKGKMRSSKYLISFFKKIYETMLSRLVKVDNRSCYVKLVKFEEKTILEPSIRKRKNNKIAKDIAEKLKSGVSPVQTLCILLIGITESKDELEKIDNAWLKPERTEALDKKIKEELERRGVIDVFSFRCTSKTIDINGVRILIIFTCDMKYAKEELKVMMPCVS